MTGNGEDTRMVPRDKQLITIKGLLQDKRMIEQMAMALPRQISADRLARVAITQIARNERLQKCTTRSLMGACLTAAQMGLEPDGIHGHLVPFGTEAVFIPGYLGLMDLARRSGMVTNIFAHIVHDNDKFTYRLGLHPTLEHEPRPDDDGERGKVVGAYAAAHIKDAEPQFIYRTFSQIEAIRNQSPSVKAGRPGPWNTHWEAMALKTVVRRLCTWLPRSVTDSRLAEAVHADEMADIGRPIVQEVILEDDKAAEVPEPAQGALDLAVQAEEQAASGAEKPQEAETPGEWGLDEEAEQTAPEQPLTLGQKVAKARKEVGHTKTEAAALISRVLPVKISAQALGKLETGETPQGHLTATQTQVLDQYAADPAHFPPKPKDEPPKIGTIDLKGRDIDADTKKEMQRYLKETDKPYEPDDIRFALNRLTKATHPRFELWADLNEGERLACWKEIHAANFAGRTILNV